MNFNVIAILKLFWKGNNIKTWGTQIAFETILCFEDCNIWIYRLYIL